MKANLVKTYTNNINTVVVNMFNNITEEEVNYTIVVTVNGNVEYNEFHFSYIDALRDFEEWEKYFENEFLGAHTIY